MTGDRRVVVLEVTYQFGNRHLSDFEDRVDALLAAGLDLLVVDAHGVRGMGPMFPQSLIRAAKKLEAHGARLVIARPNALIRAVFDPPDAEPLLPVFETVEDAFAAS